MLAELSRDEHELLARIAHRSLIDRRTQGEIADEFGLSRPKVQRLLDRARSAGVVEIHIDVPQGLDLELESRLAERFRLTESVVSPSHADPESQREAVARNAARYLERSLRDGDVVAVSHGRDTGAVPRHFHPPSNIDCVFASAMGGSSRVDVPTNPNEIGQALAERCGGRVQSLYAPVYVESQALRRGLLRHEAVTQTLEMAAGADVALVGIGGTDDACTMVRSGCLTIEEMARLRAQGAVGDVLGNYVDVHGEHIQSPHSRRLIGLSIDQLRKVETVVAVVSGDEKPLSILGVLNAGIVDVLIVDERNARAVLDMATNGGD